MVSTSNFPALSTFYAAILTPLSYSTYLSRPNFIGFVSDYPYIWLKALPPDVKPVPTHIAFDTQSNEAVDEFYRVALLAGGRDNGAPGIRNEHGRQPYYAAFVLDVEGNNVEAVCVDKAGKV